MDQQRTEKGLGITALWHCARAAVQEAQSVVLMPDSRLANWAHRAALIASMCKYTETPMAIAFEADPFQQPFYSLWELGLFSIFVVDMFCTAHQAYFDDSGRLIEDLRQIQRNYWRGKFFDNLIASVPLAFIFKPFLSKDSLRYFKILPILHIGRYYRAVMNEEMSINASRKYTLVVFLIFVLQVVHWTACAWWMFEQTLVSQSSNWTRERPLADMYSEELKANPYRRYPYMVEYMVTVFLNRGRFWSSSVPEMVVLLMLNGLGTLLVAGYVALYVSYLSNTLRNKVLTEQTIQRIQAYLRQHRISHLAAKRVVDYYRHILLDWHGQICTDDVLSDLPVVVQSEVTYMVRGSHLEQCPLFSHCSLPFIQFLCANSTETYLARAETLTVSGAGGTAMFVIKYGRAHVLSDDNRRVWGEIGPGGMVGEVAALFNQTHNCTVVAVCPCEVIVLRQAVLLYALEAFPEDGAFVLELVGEQQRQSVVNLQHARLNTVSYPPAAFKRIPLQKARRRLTKGEMKVPFARRKDRAAALREELADAAIFVIKSRWLKKTAKDRRFFGTSSANSSATAMSMSLSGASSFFSGSGAAPPIIARIPVVSNSPSESSSTHSIPAAVVPATVPLEPPADILQRPRQRVRTNSIVSFTQQLGPIAEVSTGHTMPRPRNNKSLEIRAPGDPEGTQSARAMPTLTTEVNMAFLPEIEATRPQAPSVPPSSTAALDPTRTLNTLPPPPLTVQAPSMPSLSLDPYALPLLPGSPGGQVLYQSKVYLQRKDNDMGLTEVPLIVTDSNESFVSASSVLNSGTTARKSSLELENTVSEGEIQQSVYLDAVAMNSRSDDRMNE